MLLQKAYESANRVVGINYDDAGNQLTLSGCCSTGDYDSADRLVRVPDRSPEVAR